MCKSSISHFEKQPCLHVCLSLTLSIWFIGVTYRSLWSVVFIKHASRPAILHGKNIYLRLCANFLVKFFHACHAFRHPWRLPSHTTFSGLCSVWSCGGCVFLGGRGGGGGGGEGTKSMRNRFFCVHFLYTVQLTRIVFGMVLKKFHALKCWLAFGWLWTSFIQIWSGYSNS